MNTTSHTTKASQVTSRTMLVTVELARLWLSTSVNNRKPNPHVVARYARDMKNGRWHVGTGSIKFTADGRLVDGQHRLLACIRAGVPFETIVDEGIAVEAVAYIDENESRTCTHRFQMREEPNARNLAAAVRMGWLWQNAAPANRTMKPSQGEADEWLERNPSIRQAVMDARPFQKTFAGPSSAVAPIIHRLRIVGGDRADDFLTAVAAGTGLYSGNPALALREWMLSQVVSRATARRALPATYMAAWVKTWNASVKGRPLKRLRFGAQESFPDVLDQFGRPAPHRDELDTFDAGLAWLSD